MISLVYSVCFGILSKLYDDVVDQKIIQNPFLIHSIQSLIIMFLTLIGYQDYYFTFACLFVIRLNSGFDHPFWNSFLPVMVFLFLTALPYGGDRMHLKMLLAICGVLFILFIAYLEEYYFPEEYSWRKVVSRIIGSIVFLMAGLFISEVPYMPQFGVEPVKKACFIMVGYLITSILLQIYALLGEGAALGGARGLDPTDGLATDVLGADGLATDGLAKEPFTATSSGTDAPVALNQA
jgi:hypothetical protein